MTNIEFLKLVHKIQRRLLAVNQAIDLTELKEPDMAVSPETAALISQFDQATDRIAARIQRLIDSSGTLSADDKAALQAEVAKLNTLGEDPANPVPPV